MNLFEEIRDKKILLIDDDESIRDSMSMFFLGEGISIDTLETAEEGVNAIKKQHYDSIITDYKLPSMDGLSFLKHIHVLCPDSFKIFLTTYGNKEEFSEATRLGADEYIVKPFTTKLIKDVLTRFMERRR